MSKTSIHRSGESYVHESLDALRVVVLNGARQCGKTTLAQAVAHARNGRYWSLDDPAILNAARRDPLSLLVDDGRLTVIDEIQRAGDPLLLSIKQVVDQSNEPGQFLLTGSSNFLTVPTLSETLAGRIGIIEMWPFSQSELNLPTPESRRNFADVIFEDPDSLRASTPDAISKAEYLGLAVVGGYPEVQALSARMRNQWFESYLATLTQREINDVVEVRRFDELRRLTALIAADSAQEFNVSRATNIVGLTRDTVRNYRALLEMVFVVTRLPAWSRNIGKRVARKEKIFIADSGIAASLVGVGVPSLMQPTSTYAGALLETFVASEVRKFHALAARPLDMFHYRDASGAEVDLLLQARNGDIAGIEVKAAQSVSTKDFRGLELLRNTHGAGFKNGIVLYTGKHVLGFGDRMTAMPISALWTAN